MACPSVDTITVVLLLQEHVQVVEGNVPLNITRYDPWRCQRTLCLMLEQGVFKYY